MTRSFQHAFKLACLLALVILVLMGKVFWRASERPQVAATASVSQRLVVASLAGDDTRWLARLPDWAVSQYVVNDATASLTVPANKGREAMVYLTYIIDNYGNLPEIIVFMHSLQYQWHNDDPNKDGAAVIKRLQLGYIQEEGYVNIRCVWALGCPAEIQLDNPQQDRETSIAFRNAFVELFPERTEDIPSVVAASCCAQFAVTSWKIRQRPREDYERIRNWLVTTPLADAMYNPAIATYSGCAG